MAIAFVQAATGSTGAYGSTTLAFSSNVVAGNLLICVGAAWDGSALASVTVTDTVGTSYTTILGATTGTTLNRTWLSYGIAAGSGANTVTIDPNGGGWYSSHSVAEFSGVHATPLDVDGSNSTGTSTTASDAITTSATNTVVIGVMSQGSNNAYTLTSDSGWNQIGEDETANYAPYSSAYQIFTSAGSKTASWTIGTSAPWAAQTVSFKQASATAFTLDAAVGSYADTGTAISTRRTYVFPGAVGSYAYTGIAAVITAGKRFPVAVGSYSLTGVTAAVKAGLRVSGAVGSYTATGTAATLTSPTAPVGIVQSSTATLTWAANTEPDLAGYTVYIGLFPGVDSSPSYTITPPAHSFVVGGSLFNSDGLWHFSVDAFDTSNNHSNKTAEVTKRIIRTNSRIIRRK